MEQPDVQPSPPHQAIIDRFIAACQIDERVVAAFLGGSYARGTADTFSDLDLCLITTDDSHADFIAGREAFMRQLGEPVFLEDFDHPDIVFYVFANGAEGELGIGRERWVKRPISKWRRRYPPRRYRLCRRRFARWSEALCSSLS
jgi:predicted nucleotidyltransferase